MTEETAATPKRRGRPPGTGFTKAQRRAQQIHKISLGAASNSGIAQQLFEEGYGVVKLPTIRKWRKDNRWDDVPLSHIPAPVTMPLNEELRQAVRVQVPDDLQRVEQASERLASVAIAICKRIEEQIGAIPITTPGELAIVSSAACEILRTQLAVGKGLQDLRLLRVSANFADPDKPKDGEIIPPDKSPLEQYISEQDRVISNFEAT